MSSFPSCKSRFSFLACREGEMGVCASSYNRKHCAVAQWRIQRSLLGKSAGTGGIIEISEAPAKDIDTVVYRILS